MKSHYHEITPHPRLAKFVECFWYSHVSDDLAQESVTKRVLPDGCADIIFKFQNEPGCDPLTPTNLADMHFVGEMTRAILVENNSQEVFLGIRFHPGYAHPFVRAPLHEFTDKTIELDAIGKPLSDKLKEGIQKETSIPGKHQLIEHTLLDFIGESFDPEPCIEYAIQAILQSKGQVSIQALCQKTGYSSRYLQKKFREVVGIGPKMLCRVVRFRNAYRSLKSSDCKQYAKTALDFGYFDQAHFNHDFKEFVGVSPSAQFLKPPG